MVYNKEKEATLSTDPVGLYLTEIGQIPLLPPEKELEIGQKIDSGRGAQEKLSQDGNLSREEKEELERLVVSPKSIKVRVFLFLILSKKAIQDCLPRLRNLTEAVTASLLKEQVKEVFKTLSAREARILGLRFGFFDGHKHTLKEVSLKERISRERVRQIEKEALQKLRHPACARTLRDFA